MAFNLDFAHLPSIEIPKLAPVENGYTDVTKTLTDKMTSDPWSLFSNPMTTDTNFIGDGVAKIEMYVKNVADGSITNPNFTSGDATTYLATDPFEDLRSSLGNLFRKFFPAKRPLNQGGTTQSVRLGILFLKKTQYFLRIQEAILPLRQRSPVSSNTSITPRKS
jgi:hypothetical protein